MALITCPECSKEVSNKAVSCPNCGFPIEEIISTVKLNDMEKQENDIPSSENYSTEDREDKKEKDKLAILKKKNVKIILGLVTFICVFLLVGTIRNIRYEKALEQFESIYVRSYYHQAYDIYNQNLKITNENRDKNNWDFPEKYYKDLDYLETISTLTEYNFAKLSKPPGKFAKRYDDLKEVVERVDTLKDSLMSVSAGEQPSFSARFNASDAYEYYAYKYRHDLSKYQLD